MDFLQKQLKYLKDNLKKCLDRRTKMTKSGAAASSLPKCNYFDQMAFLLEKAPMNLPTESNVLIPKPSSNACIGIDLNVEPIPTPSTNNLFTPPQSPLVHTENGNETVLAPREKRKKSNESCERDKILKEINTIEKELRISERDECEDTLFCRSLVPTLRKLSAKKNKIAKIKISQLLFELEFDESCE